MQLQQQGDRKEEANYENLTKSKNGRDAATTFPAQVVAGMP